MYGRKKIRSAQNVTDVSIFCSVIVMNEDPLAEARIQKGRTSHQRATEDEDIKLMLVNVYPVPTPTTTPREVITPTPNILKMKVLPV